MLGMRHRREPDCTMFEMMLYLAVHLSAAEQRFVGALMMPSSPCRENGLKNGPFVLVHEIINLKTDLERQVQESGGIIHCRSLVAISLFTSKVCTC